MWDVGRRMYDQCAANAVCVGLQTNTQRNGITASYAEVQSIAQMPTNLQHLFVYKSLFPKIFQDAFKVQIRCQSGEESGVDREAQASSDPAETLENERGRRCCTVLGQ